MTDQATPAKVRLTDGLDPDPERDCPHGQLARACDRCADAREIAELRAAPLGTKARKLLAWLQRSKDGTHIDVRPAERKG